MTTPKPRRTRGNPHGLGARGRAFWAAARRAYEFTDSEAELLVETARLMDEIEALGDALGRDGMSVPGHAGQPRVHPAVAQLRQHRLALGRLLAQLALPDLDGATLASPARTRAQRAAAERWAGHARRGGRGASA